MPETWALHFEAWPAVGWSAKARLIACSKIIGRSQTGQIASFVNVKFSLILWTQSPTPPLTLMRGRGSTVLLHLAVLVVRSAMLVTAIYIICKRHVNAGKAE